MVFLYVDHGDFNSNRIINLLVTNSKVNSILIDISHCSQIKFSMSSLTFFTVCGIIHIDKYNDLQSKFSMEGIYGNQTGSLFE